MSGVPQYNWGAVEESFATWTSPAGEPISPADRATIRARLDLFMAEQKLRIGIGPAMTMDELLAPFKRAGSKITKRSDGTIVVERRRPPELWIGAAAAVGALGVLFLWRPPTLLREIVWAALMLVAAFSLMRLAQRLAESGRPGGLVRWIARGLVVGSLAVVVIALWQRR